MDDTARAAALDSPSLLQDLMERLPAGIAIKDADLRYIYVNPYLRALMAADHWIGKNILEIKPDDDGRLLIAEDARALGGERIESEMSVSDATGATRRFRVEKFPMRHEGGGPLVGCILSDVTELKAAEASLAAALDAKDSLLKEVYHRVKNNLATVASLLSLEAATLRDERAIKAFEECQSRIQSMALVHEELYASEDLSRLDFGPYVTKIAQRLFHSTGASIFVRLEIDAESVFLDSAVAVPLGLVANELLTNALKYAFPEGRRGQLSVRLRRQPPWAVLTVSDDGAGIPAGFDPMSASSLGLQLVRGLARQVGGSAEFRTEGGFECRVAFPVPET